MDNAPTLGFLLHDVARLLRKRFEQRARDLGLTRSQWQTLAYLNVNEGIHQSGLADILEIEPITLVRILDRLQERGLVERRQHPKDRRIWLLYLKDAARPLIAEMRGMGDATRAEALEGLSEAERAELARALGLMKSNLIAACAQPVGDKEAKHG
jgi:MarR family transcriptional regulator, transcriptional regulator for hemolysin